MTPDAPDNQRPVMVGLGEVLWDLLPAGRQLGGAPANFAYHACALGAEARLITRVGTDDLGREALQRLEGLGLSAVGIQHDPALPTGTVSVEVGADGQPHFIIHESVAWDALQDTAAGRALMEDADAIYFGTLAQRAEISRSAVRALVAGARRDVLRILDVNLRQHFYSDRVIEDSLRLANVLKINDTELPRLASCLRLTGDERCQVAQLADRYQLRCVAFTRGARGSLLFAQGKWSDHPGVRTQVVDTIGAGDAFTAAMAFGLLANWPLDEVNQRAGELAAFVCSQPGATPRVPETLCAPFRSVRRSRLSRRTPSPVKDAAAAAATSGQS